MKQRHLAGKSLQLEFSNFCRSLQSNSREVKACSFKKISSIMNKTTATLHISHFSLCFLHGGSFLHIQLMEAKQILIPVCKYPGVICLQCRHALDTCWIPLTGMQTPGMNWSACVDYSYWYSDGKKHWFFDFYAYLCSPLLYGFDLHVQKLCVSQWRWAVASHRGPVRRSFYLQTLQGQSMFRLTNAF